jgi:hypothetical protein
MWMRIWDTATLSMAGVELDDWPEFPCGNSLMLPAVTAGPGGMSSRTPQTTGQRETRSATRTWHCAVNGR